MDFLVHSAKMQTRATQRESDAVHQGGFIFRTHEVLEKRVWQMEMEQMMNHAAIESVNGASLGTVIGLNDVSPVRAILALSASAPNDEVRWTTVAEVTVGQYQYRLIRCNAKKLTRRETEVLERVMRGASNKVIAFDLGIAHSTVRVLLFRAMLKLGLKKRTELVALLQETTLETPAPLNATAS